MHFGANNRHISSTSANSDERYEHIDVEVYDDIKSFHFEGLMINLREF